MLHSNLQGIKVPCIRLLVEMEKVATFLSVSNNTSIIILVLAYGPLHEKW